MKKTIALIALIMMASGTAAKDMTVITISDKEVEEILNAPSQAINSVNDQGVKWEVGVGGGKHQIDFSQINELIDSYNKSFEENDPDKVGHFNIDAPVEGLSFSMSVPSQHLKIFLDVDYKNGYKQSVVVRKIRYQSDETSNIYGYASHYSADLESRAIPIITIGAQHNFYLSDLTLSAGAGITWCRPNMQGDMDTTVNPWVNGAEIIGSPSISKDHFESSASSFGFAGKIEGEYEVGNGFKLLIAAKCYAVKFKINSSHQFGGYMLEKDEWGYYTRRVFRWLKNEQKQNEMNLGWNMIAGIAYSF